MLFQTHLMFHKIHENINNYEQFYAHHNDEFILLRFIILYSFFHQELIILMIT